MPDKIVLQKYISSAGIGSRRQAGQMIEQGRVKINGRQAKLGDRVSFKVDKVEVDGNIIQPAAEKVYYLVNKPVGYASTVRDKHARKKVVDLAPRYPKVWPVGRLDQNSRGLIILTNYGDFTNKLTHPKFKHEKEYELTADKQIGLDLLNQLKTGIKLEEGWARADKVKQVGPKKLIIVLHQGWKRQIRRMLLAAGYKVKDLNRIRVGKWTLGNLKEGECKQIKPESGEDI